MYLDMPTDEQLAAKRVPLTTSDDDSIRAREVPAYPQVSQLVGFMEASGIPMSALIRYGGCGSHELVLEWD